MWKIVTGDKMITIYTAIFGDYDLLREPFYTNPNIKYICFSDKKHYSKIWEIRVVDIIEPTPRREARKYKILSHKYIDTKISLWIDGSKFITRNPIPYIRTSLKKTNILAGSHKRNCIYAEAEKCISVKKGNPNIIKKQMEKYRKEKYPKNNGLINSSVLLRRITPEVIKIEEGWWYELTNWSVRDQLSFNYVIWKNNFKYGIIDWRKFVGGGLHKKRINARQARKRRRK